jgi:hypothetical protein
MKSRESLSETPYSYLVDSQDGEEVARSFHFVFVFFTAIFPVITTVRRGRRKQANEENEQT